MPSTRPHRTTHEANKKECLFSFFFFFYLDGGVDGPEVNGLEDVPVELAGLLRLERQAHLDESVREPLRRGRKRVSYNTDVSEKQARNSMSSSMVKKAGPTTLTPTALTPTTLTPTVLPSTTLTPTDMPFSAGVPPVPLFPPSPAAPPPARPSFHLSPAPRCRWACGACWSCAPPGSGSS